MTRSRCRSYVVRSYRLSLSKQGVARDHLAHRNEGLLVERVVFDRAERPLFSTNRRVVLWHHAVVDHVVQDYSPRSSVTGGEARGIDGTRVEQHGAPSSTVRTTCAATHTHTHHHCSGQQCERLAGRISCHDIILPQTRLTKTFRLFSDGESGEFVGESSPVGQHYSTSSACGGSIARLARREKPLRSAWHRACRERATDVV